MNAAWPQQPAITNPASMGAPSISRERARGPRAGAPSKLAPRGHAALETLVREHRAWALRVARRRLHDPSGATDIVQQAFLRVLEALPRYEERGAFAAYLYTVLRNLCRMDNRSLGARARLADALRQHREAEPRRDRDGSLGLERLLEQLSERLRQVVVLRYFAGLDQGEIATRLGVPVGTVRRRHFDAMTKLFALLHE
jgi:RNA polymerase sigma factor (sigma-70 family)